MLLQSATARGSDIEHSFDDCCLARFLASGYVSTFFSVIFCRCRACHADSHCYNLFAIFALLNIANWILVLLIVFRFE